MRDAFVCANGHHWQLSADGPVPADSPYLVCPRCGSRSQNGTAAEEALAATQPVAPPHAGIGVAGLVVFIASFCTLVIELVASRILAPHLGVSLYTWTTIIGVVLAGISVGAYLGGLLADRFPYQGTLGWLLFL